MFFGKSIYKTKRLELKRLKSKINNRTQITDL